MNHLWFATCAFTLQRICITFCLSACFNFQQPGLIPAVAHALCAHTTNRAIDYFKMCIFIFDVIVDGTNTGGVLDFKHSGLFVNVKLHIFFVPTIVFLSGGVLENLAIWGVGVKCIVALLHNLYIVWWMMLPVIAWERGRAIIFNIWGWNSPKRVSHRFSWKFGKSACLLSLTARFSRTLPLKIVYDCFYCFR